MFPKYKLTIWLIVACLAIGGWAVPAAAQVLPLEQENTITANWLVYKDNTNELVPHVEGENTDKHALHQWLQVSPEKPFRISFVAPEGLSLFLNNQLVFVADSTAEYKVDLAPLTKNIPAADNVYLLTVWHPEQKPLVRSFKNARVQVPARNSQSSQTEAGVVPVKREIINQSTFILFILLIGLLYGSLRSSYPTDFRNLYQASSFLRSNATLQGPALVKPLTSLSSILFMVAFALSMGVMIAAMQTEVLHIQLLSNFIPASASGISFNVVYYSILVFLFILLKYLFLRMMAFIFSLEQVVELQYHEFLRTILFLGIFLPALILFYLAFNVRMPQVMLIVFNAAIALMLIITIVRVFAAVNTRVPVLNLHLFSYLCATEVIPLAIILKLIVFNF